MEDIDVEEDVDVESEFLLERDAFTAENILKVSEIADSNSWPVQTVGDDVDSESKDMILSLLESDEAAASYPLAVRSTHKTTEAMKKTSRRQLWCEEDKALFETGVEIYGRSWKNIAELLPHKTLSQVTSYGIQCFKKKKNMLHNVPNNQREHAASKPPVTGSAVPVTSSAVRSSAVHPLISNAEIHVLEECDRDEDVDIMSDGSVSGLSPRYSSSNELLVSTTEGVRLTSTACKDNFAVKVPTSPAMSCYRKLSSVSDSEEVCEEVYELAGNSQTGENVAEKKCGAEFPFVDYTSFSSTRPATLSTTDSSQDINLAGADSGLISSSAHFAGISIPSVGDLQGGANSESHLKSGDFNKCGSKTETNTGMVSALISAASGTAVHDSHTHLTNNTDASCKGTAEDGGCETEVMSLEYYTPAKMSLDYGVLNSNGELVPLPAPEAEILLDKGTISVEEKQIHFEFFEGRANKTPERYLRIRNYVAEQWLLAKPRYVNKTSIRTGLKHCGDVNCIGRIHAYLEQVGAINFGCPQAVYKRMALAGRSVREKCMERSSSVSLQRVRKRKPAAKGTFTADTTYEHGSDEELPTPPTKNSKTSSSKASNLDSFALISCADFSHFKMSCPYQVILESTAAVVMDIHSHLCKTEVIGLLGGSYGSGNLRVVRAEPCWSKSTSLHCDMDPVSQTQAGEMIRQAGLQVIGWYHSHPTFVPNPSQQDIDSQEIFQKWFSKGGDHFLGIIISPYNTTNKAVNSEIRCFTTATPSKSSNYYRTSSIPFKFDYKVETSTDNNELVDLVPKISRLLDMYKHYEHTVDLLDTYRSSNDLSSLDKVLLSVASYLQTADEKFVDRSLVLEDIRFVLTSYCEGND